MQVASKDLCQKLYKLSGWDNAPFDWIEIPTWNKKFPKPQDQVIYNHICDNEHQKWIAPAYDLGYLLRKLPSHFSFEPDTIGEEIYCLRIENSVGVDWTASYGTIEDPYKRLGIMADTPEDAACKLAIELFKQGILTKQKTGKQE